MIHIWKKSTQIRIELFASFLVGLSGFNLLIGYIDLLLLLANIEQGRIWIGRPEHYSHLHYDAHDGLLCCVTGVKEVWLYDPLGHTYSIRQISNGRNAALVNPIKIDNEKYPEFAQATPIKCKIS
jgi:hypothetical protein